MSKEELDRGDDVVNDDYNEEETQEQDYDDESDNKEVEAKQEQQKHYIPKERFDEVNNRMKDAERRQQWLEEQLATLINDRQPKEPEPVVIQYDFDDAEARYADLLISGELDEAKKLRREINVQNQLVIDSRMKELKSSLLNEAENRVRGLSEEDKVTAIIEDAKNKYTALNDNNPDFDQDLVNDINALTVGYIQRGDSKSKAIQKAIDKLVAPGKKKTSLGATRVASARKAPGRLEGTTSTVSDLDGLDVTRLSNKEFKDLTPRERAILRGDRLN